MDTTEGKVALKVFVHKEKPQVLFAEADKDFVDVLFSFLTLPLGKIVKLIGKEAKIGSLNGLYQSVSNLEQQYFSTEVCQDMLLNPRNSSQAHCRKLKVNADDTEPTKYFRCKSLNMCSHLSTYKNARCTCGTRMSDEIRVKNSSLSIGDISKDGVFVHETASFIITEDLHVVPNLMETSIALLNHLGIQDINLLEKRILSFGLKEILDLLKWSLVTNNPLTNLVFGETHLSSGRVNPKSNGPLGPAQVGDNNSVKMSVKLLVQKSNQKVLYAEVEEGFIDFLFTFLAIPLGSVEYVLDGNSSLHNIDNLYSSISSLSVKRYLKSEDLKAMLLHPNLDPNFLCDDHILPLHECQCQFYFHWSDSYLSKTPPSHESAKLSFLDPKKPNQETIGLGGFIKRPALFMVTDDLVVAPLSSISNIFDLNKLNISLGDVELQMINIGTDQAKEILKASLNSTSVFTDTLAVILKKPKEEPNL